MLNTELIVERRLTLGLTHRRLARLLGVSSATVGRIEAGEAAAYLTLADVHRLAEALEVERWELLVLPTRESARAETDDVAVEALLAASPRRLPPAEIAKALEWSLRRVGVALSALEARLQNTGQRLARNRSGEVGLRAHRGALAESTWENSAQTYLQYRGVTQSAGSLLLEIHREGSIPVPKDNARRVAAGELVRAGIASLDANTLSLTQRAAFSLSLDAHSAVTGIKRRRGRAKRPQ